ncbi:MAG: hypothetical protein ACRDKF_06290 [Actinomycetota bacterium]
MTRRQLRTIHLSGAIIAQLVVGSFLIATVAAEVTGDEAVIAAVKGAVARAVFLLAPVMIVTGLSGRRLAGKSRAEIVVRKMRRMRLIGINALVVLIPCALALGRLAADRSFGTSFMAPVGGADGGVCELHAARAERSRWTRLATSPETTATEGGREWSLIVINPPVTSSTW